VPSVALLDDLDRWNLVVFLDKLPADLSTLMQATFDGTAHITSAGASL
jgi:hypothetical protein